MNGLIENNSKEDNRVSLSNLILRAKANVHGREKSGQGIRISQKGDSLRSRKSRLQGI